MWPNLQFPWDLVTFIEEILYGKLDFLCSVSEVLPTCFKSGTCYGQNRKRSFIIQLTFTFSKSTIETLKVWNMFRVNNKNTRTTSLTFFRCFCCLLWTYFTYLSSISVVKFEQVNVRWAVSCNFMCKILRFTQFNGSVLGRFNYYFKCFHQG